MVLPDEVRDVFKQSVDEKKSEDTPSPVEVHESRSEYAQKQDEARDARLTTDPEKYASDPDSYDFPYVDTTRGVEQELMQSSDDVEEQLGMPGSELMGGSGQTTEKRDATSINFERDRRDESRINNIRGVEVGGEEVSPLDYGTEKELSKVTDKDPIKAEAWEELQEAVESGDVKVEAKRDTLQVEEI